MSEPRFASVLDEDYSDVDLAARIAAVKREVALRANVYPKLIAAKKMTPDEARKNERAMRAVLQTLLRLEQSAPAAADPAKALHVVTLEIAIDRDEPVDPPGQWDWPALLDMPPDDVRVVAVKEEAP